MSSSMDRPQWNLHLPLSGPWTVHGPLGLWFSWAHSKGTLLELSDSVNLAVELDWNFSGRSLELANSVHFVGGR